ncbi:KDO2-lipid IV(A) lauroyltransferase [Stella humosa]|uniref:KDO2-lipid IV(A) lauroyltransferase n=1 Tax=Stella humosa TaxID=94 RepID=A0A3N1L1C8_9PROT|nr:lipid A biosynthesis lauroyl acyltransferase [Stella humosa]ROP83315.1 KDO2-lipid IV(A) lauroyltransferase [Stella humosa]BBK29902.1 lipid A biosynthesis lauroyl acyltransferase [Stella humosa]
MAMLRLKLLLLRWATAVGAGLVTLFFLAARVIPYDWMAAFGGGFARLIGPHLRPSRTARANLELAFPEKSPAEREAILRGAWDNLGRTAVEYPYIGRLWDYDPERPDATGRIEVVGQEHFLSLRDDGRPGIVFAAHLANWELLAVAAARHGLEIAVLYREPNNPAIARIIRRIRGQNMGRLIPTDLRGGLALVGVLKGGGHVGMLVDQHFSRGPLGRFFGHPVRTAPAAAKFARAFDCPIHGARVMRLEGGRFRLEITPPLVLPPPSDNPAADEAALTQTITGIIEGWVRDRPQDWLWMHRRWRVPASEAPAMPPAPQKHAADVDKPEGGR